MDTSDVKDMAENTSRRIKNYVQDESPMERIREASEHADETIRSFAKQQPVTAMILALSAGYLLGRAVARAT